MNTEPKKTEFVARGSAQSAVDRSPASHAIGELAVMGSDVATLLAAVDAGATLIITGPDPLGKPNSRFRFGATLESHSRARDANAYGASLVEVMAELAKQWRTK